MIKRIILEISGLAQNKLDSITVTALLFENISNGRIILKILISKVTIKSNGHDETSK